MLGYTLSCMTYYEHLYRVRYGSFDDHRKYKAKHVVILVLMLHYVARCLISMVSLIRSDYRYFAYDSLARFAFLEMFQGEVFMIVSVVGLYTYAMMVNYFLFLVWPESFVAFDDLYLVFSHIKQAGNGPWNSITALKTNPYLSRKDQIRVTTLLIRSERFCRILVIWLSVIGLAVFLVACGYFLFVNSVTSALLLIVNIFPGFYFIVHIVKITLFHQIYTYTYMHMISLAIYSSRDCLERALHRKDYKNPLRKVLAIVGQMEQSHRIFLHFLTQLIKFNRGKSNPFFMVSLMCNEISSVCLLVGFICNDFPLTIKLIYWPILIIEYFVSFFCVHYLIRASSKLYCAKQAFNQSNLTVFKIIKEEKNNVRISNLVLFKNAAVYEYVYPRKPFRFNVGPIGHCNNRSVVLFNLFNVNVLMNVLKAHYHF